MSGTEPSVEEVLQELDPTKRKSIERILYGTTVEPLPLSSKEQQQATDLAIQHDFELRVYRHSYNSNNNNTNNDNTKARIVRAAVIQNAIVAPTTAPVAVQRRAIHDRMRCMIQAAATAGANIVGLQECWTGPFFMCTREKRPWCDFAEEAERGPTFDFISTMARRYGVVIISPILERDVKHGGTLWNTAVVVNHTGKFLGKHRKNHIPRVGDFNESTYYMEGNTGHPVFDTTYGKIAVNICYGRHHPLNWTAFGLNGAELVFNPCATVGTLSEPMWPIEGRCAAIANNFFVLSNNRVGTETFPNGTCVFM